MIITRTPFRMSFFGGGSDIQSHFSRYGGSVLSTTFDKYCYVMLRRLPRFFERGVELSHAKTEAVSGADEMERPSIRNAMQWLNMPDIRLTYDAELPVGSGLGASSSFAVGMLNAFYALKGERVDKKKLADDAIYLERVLCAEAGGWQDQIAASYGGLNRIHFHPNGSYEVLPVSIRPERKERLCGNLMMFYTGFTRFSSEVHKENARSFADNAEILCAMAALTDSAEKILTDSQSDLDEFGFLLDETWRLKRRTGENITTSRIDSLYETGLRAGALGGKLLGAGGGGFLLFYVREERRRALKNALGDLLHVPFRFEESGSRVIYDSPETYVREEEV